MILLSLQRSLIRLKRGSWKSLKKTLKHEERGTLCIKEPDAEIKKAEKLYGASTSSQPAQESGSEAMNQWTLFRPQSNLEPVHLEQGGNHFEVSKFGESMKTYIIVGGLCPVKEFGCICPPS